MNADGSVTLTWEAPESAKACYTYEVFIQDNVGNLLNGAPAFIGEDKNGVRKINRMGRIGCLNTWTFNPPTAGTYKWGVQTIDATYTGSTFTEGPEFNVTSQEDGINNIEHSTLNIEHSPDAVYDISGRKVTKTSHLIIRDGRKTLK